MGGEIEKKKMRTGEFTVAKRKKAANEGSYRKLLRNTAVCAAILVGVALLSGIDGVIAPAGSSQLAEDKELGRLQFVMSEPVEGEVIETFAESGKEAVVSAEPRTPVRAVLSGRVFSTGKTQIVIANDNGTRTAYEGVVPGIKAGAGVAAGDIIGQTSGERLSLYTVSGIGYIDPLSGEAEIIP